MVKLLSVALFIGYIVGIWKFWHGFHRTNFNRNLPNRLKLALLWPILLLINNSYRENFQKALRGR